MRSRSTGNAPLTRTSCLHSDAERFRAIMRIFSIPCAVPQNAQTPRVRVVPSGPLRAWYPCGSYIPNYIHAICYPAQHRFTPAQHCLGHRCVAASAREFLFCIRLLSPIIVPAIAHG